jgi:hypothetical protein
MDTPPTEAHETPCSADTPSTDFGALFAKSGMSDSVPAGIEDDATPSDTAARAVAQPGADLTLYNTGIWPSWLSKAMDYLKGISTSPEWVTLITKLVAFEEVLGFPSSASLIHCYNVFRILTE